jgi:SAM-dependent methyltransferase
MTGRLRQDGEDTMEDVRSTVREVYGRVGAADATGTGCCGPGGDCGGTSRSADEIARGLGYVDDEISAVPDGANLGLGCGNPQVIAGLRPGETVLDLGSGGGIDSFLAARAVGDGGRVIGVDMTPEMVHRARENARKAGVGNVDFRLGEIEHLPVRDASVDVIISNCVINLSPTKQEVFREAFRVLKSGGRVAIMDVVATKQFPDEVRNDPALHASCVSGAVTVPELEEALAEAGFEDIRVTRQHEDRETIGSCVTGDEVEAYVVPATIEATRP